MSQSHNVEPQWRTAFFARTSFEQNLQLIQQQHLTTIEEVLKTEHAEKILVFEVDNDPSGEPSKLSWFV
jgi:hypothetical protein